jgi:hypothetical protein
MKLSYLLPLLAIGWIPAAAGNEAPASEISEYVYLHVTRSEGVPRAMSCRARVQPIRS